MAAPTDPHKKVKCVGMDNNQARVIELLREVHLIAFKEIERLNLRIVELEDRNRQPTEKPPGNSTVSNPPTVNSPSLLKQPEMLTERQVAEYLNMSVSLLHKWRMLRKGPKFVKIGRAVRYKRGDVEIWMNSLA
jgi:predicted DNA-binding transcriptional regulator AlpA